MLTRYEHKRLNTLLEKAGLKTIEVPTEIKLTQSEIKRIQLALMNAPIVLTYKKKNLRVFDYKGYSQQSGLIKERKPWLKRKKATE